MNDPQSILRTVTRVIEAELKPDAVVILVSFKGECHMQPAGDPIRWPVLVLSAAARCAGMLAEELGQKTSENCGQSADKPKPSQEGKAT